MKKFGVPALAGSCASEARRNPTKVGTPNAKQNPAKLLLTCLARGVKACSPKRELWE